MEDELIINVGTLSSWNSLYRNIAPKLDYLREQHRKGRKPLIYWNFSYIQAGRVSMSALTAFLSIAQSVRKTYKEPPIFFMDWDPSMVKFLVEINFFKVAKELDIIRWDPNLIGDRIKKDFNPNSTVLYFNDIPNKEDLLKNKLKLNEWKETKRESLIIEELYSRIDSLFTYESFFEEWKQHLVNLLTMVVAELIVNSLLHGQDTAFVGLQKSPRGITVCICDSGQGFLSSMTNNQTWVNNVRMNKDIDALLNASLMTKDEIGLRRAISDITESNGYIILSSVDCELRWTEANWLEANRKFDFINYKNTLQSAKAILGEEKDIDNHYQHLDNGYYRTFSSKLKGTRITFEIPSNK